MVLKTFQRKAKNSLLDLLKDSTKKTINFQAPTAAGKTIILSSVIESFLGSHDNVIFIWLTPGAGELEEQSLDKFNKYSDTYTGKSLDDVLKYDFEDKDVVFVNWEQLTKKDNRALREAETKNLIDRIETANDNGFSFILVVDEAHKNNTDKALKVADLFGKNAKRIYATATFDSKEIIDVKVEEKDVINSGLITKLLSVNEGITEIPEISNKEYETLIDLAVKKQLAIEKEYINHKLDLVPMIIVQYPMEKENDAEVERLIDNVDNYLNTKYGYTYDNEMVARWLNGDKKNIGSDNQPLKTVKVLHIKQAIATGWDCPRAKILVKLRTNMEKTFEIQTLGRIRRMPEQKHYGIPLMDNCFLYTYDEKYKEEVISHFDGKETVELFIKEKYKSLNLGIKKQERSKQYTASGKKEIGKDIRNYIIKKYDLEKISGDDTKKKEIEELNKQKLKDNGFTVDQPVMRSVLTGVYSELHELATATTGKVSIKEAKTRAEERDHYRNTLRSISGHLNKENLTISTVERVSERLFRSPSPKHKDNGIVLRLSEKEYWTFFINNHALIERIIREAAHDDGLKSRKIVYVPDESDYLLPSKDLVCVKNKKGTSYYKKNIFENYPIDVIPGTGKEKSNVEIKFEKWLEENDDVEWWYKNGDKGPIYLSLVYTNNFDGDYLFYPDYIYKSKSKGLYITETKGGWRINDDSKNIDKDNVSEKFDALKKYVEEYNNEHTDKIHGMFVRDDEIDSSTSKLLYNNTKWSEEKNENWKEL